MLSTKFLKGASIPWRQAAISFNTSREFAFKAKDEKDENNTYENVKKMARKTGDAAKEWMQGSSTKGSSVYKAAKRGTEEAYETMRRGVPGSTRDAAASELHRISKQSAATGTKRIIDTTDLLGEKIADAANHAAEALKEVVGGSGEEPGMNSARAVWQEMRSPEQKKAEEASPKSRVTDEAFGDDPTKNRTRDEKRILPNDFYTKH